MLSNSLQAKHFQCNISGLFVSKIFIRCQTKTRLLIGSCFETLNSSLYELLLLKRRHNVCRFHKTRTEQLSSCIPGHFSGPFVIIPMTMSLRKMAAPWRSANSQEFTPPQIRTVSTPDRLVNCNPKTPLPREFLKNKVLDYFLIN